MCIRDSLKGQQRLYPQGATVAVSGLIKEGPYGVTFQDPLIEVLESSAAEVRSRSIGRLMPVYGLTEGVAADRFRQLIDQVLPLARSWPEPSARLSDGIGRWSVCRKRSRVCMHRTTRTSWIRPGVGWCSMNSCCCSSGCCCGDAA